MKPRVRTGIAITAVCLILCACSTPKTMRQKTEDALKKTPQPQVATDLGKKALEEVTEDAARDAAVEIDWKKANFLSGWQPKNPAAASEDKLVSTGVKAMQEHRWDEGIRIGSEIITVNPKSFHGYDLRSRCYLGAKQYEEAVADASKLIEMDDTYSDAYAVRALALTGLKRYEDALDDANKAVSLGYNEDYIGQLKNQLEDHLRKTGR